MDKIKLGFFKKIKIAIFNLEKYSQFALEKTSESLKYLIKLTLLFSLIISLAITYKTAEFMNDSKQRFENEVPDFQILDNTLTTSSTEPIILENSELIDYSIIIDSSEDITEEQIEEYKKKIELYNFGAIFLKNEIIIKNSMTMNNNLETYSYDNALKLLNDEDNSINKQDLLNKINELEPFALYISLYLTFALYMFASYFIATLFETVLLFIMGFFTCKLVNLKLKNNQIYNIAIYSLTLSVLLNAIYIPIRMIANFNIEYFQIMYTTISVIYLVTSILMMRTEMIKQQSEVQKIEEVQKQVHEEINEETKENEEEKKKEDKEKKENKKLGDEGESPEPTN